VRLIFLLLLVWLPGQAKAAVLEKVRVFNGNGHTRILLIADSPIAGMETRSSPGTAIAPARATLILPGTTRGPDVGENIPIQERGIQRLTLADLGEALQFNIEMKSARMLRARAIGKAAILVDLTMPGRGVDPSLPTVERLDAWLRGVSLIRAAGGPPRNRKLVVVDPGHGGRDHGAIGTQGTREADIALEISRRTAAALQERLGVDVILTRNRDEFISLRDRAALANTENADLFVSIHANAAFTDGPHGIETYSLSSASDAAAARVARRENVMAKEWSDDGDPLLGRLIATGTDRLSKELAHEVQSTVVRRLRATYGEAKIADLGSKTAMFYVLVSTRMPAILFESSFVSNPEDERRLRTPHFQQAQADAIVAAIGSWFARQKEE
jgi:N-acetylmuramoyl-L-alanine amidase